MTIFKIEKLLLVGAFIAAFSLYATAADDQPDYQAMYDDCVEEEGPINNGVVDACSNHVSDAAKREMNQLYNDIVSRLENSEFGGDESIQELEETQKAWLEYRGGQCHLATTHVGSPMAGYCPMQLNIERVEELRELRQGMPKTIE